MRGPLLLGPRTFCPRTSSPPEDALHARDAHSVHDVPGQPEGDGLGGGERLPLLEGHAWKHTGA